MRIWRKQKNRRVGRGQVLDVKLRSSKLRAARMRMVALGLGSFFALVLGMCLCFWLYNFLRETIKNNPAFNLTEIDVQTDGVLSPGQLQRWSGVKKGQSLLGLDLDDIRRKLEMVPLVESVVLERVPPNLLRMRVVERVPVAQINLPQRAADGGIEFKTCHVDGKGFVFIPPTAIQRSRPASPESLPTITGVHPADVQPGRRVESPQFQAALELLEAFDRSHMAGISELKRIDISAPGILSATVQPECVITFGVRNHEMQLARWRQIYDAARNMGKALATVDLAVSNNVPITLSDAGAASLPAPKPNPKHPQSRRKHV